jgi:hypothetical protein
VRAAGRSRRFVYAKILDGNEALPVAQKFDRAQFGAAGCEMIQALWKA